METSLVLVSNPRVYVSITYLDSLSPTYAILLVVGYADSSALTLQPASHAMAIARISSFSNWFTRTLDDNSIDSPHFLSVCVMHASTIGRADIEADSKCKGVLPLKFKKLFSVQLRNLVKLNELVKIKISYKPSDEVGLDVGKCKVLAYIGSPEIAQGVHGHRKKKPEGINAVELTEVRKDETCTWLHLDGQSHLTVEYKNVGGAMVPFRVRAVLISTKHDEVVPNAVIAADLMEHVLKSMTPEKCLDEK